VHEGSSIYRLKSADDKDTSDASYYISPPPPQKINQNNKEKREPKNTPPPPPRTPHPKERKNNKKTPPPKRTPPTGGTPNKGKENTPTPTPHPPHPHPPETPPKNHPPQKKTPHPGERDPKEVKPSQSPWDEAAIEGDPVNSYPATSQNEVRPRGSNFGALLVSAISRRSCCFTKSFGSAPLTSSRSQHAKVHRASGQHDDLSRVPSHRSRPRRVSEVVATRIVVEPTS